VCLDFDCECDMRTYGCSDVKQRTSKTRNDEDQIAAVFCHCFLNWITVHFFLILKQVTFNVTLRRVRELLLSWKSNKCYTLMSVCVRARACSLAYPACNLYVCAILWRHMWPLWLHHIFWHYLINDTILEKMLLYIKCVFWFSLHILSETFLTLRRI
jgi:hypothetical protein